MHSAKAFHQDKYLLSLVKGFHHTKVLIVILNDVCRHNKTIIVYPSTDTKTNNNAFRKSISSRQIFTLL